MAISFPLTLPDTGFVKARFRLIRNQAITRDPYARTAKILHRQGDGWGADFSLPPMEVSAAATWIAWKVSLQGMVGTFYAGDPKRSAARGTVPGSPLVKGASQTGTSLITDGWTPTQTGILLAYDYIEIENRLYMNVEDANSNGAGEATLSLEPALRTSPANNAVITTTNPRAIMRLTAPDLEWDEGVIFWEGLHFSAEDTLA